MEQFDQVDEIPRFQALQEGLNRSPSPTEPFNPLLEDSTSDRLKDESASTKSFSTCESGTDTKTVAFSPGVSGLDFMYSYQDRNLSPNNEQLDNQNKHGVVRNREHGKDEGVTPSSSYTKTDINKGKVAKPVFSPEVTSLKYMYGYRDANISPNSGDKKDDSNHEDQRMMTGVEEEQTQSKSSVGETSKLSSPAVFSNAIVGGRGSQDGSGMFYPSPAAGVPELDFMYSFRDDGHNEQVLHEEHVMGADHHEGASKVKEAKCIGPCKVCGDDASGMYFGALVCVPCKTFFLRYYGDNFSFVCRNQKDCEINMKTRTQCKYCRMQKCLQVGMLRRVRPSQVQISEGQQLCVVCSDLANGLHFGAITCEGCKKFFRRGLKEHPAYVCKNDKDCVINPRTRNACRFCRYQKCLAAGMCREAIQMGRPSKFRGHSLYNSNLPFPNKVSRTDANGSVADGTNNVPISLGSGLSPDGSGGSQYSTNVPLSGLPPNNSTFSPNMMPKSLPIPPLDPTQLINMVNAAVTKMDFPLMIDAQQQQHMPEVKQEPPDYPSFNPYTSSHTIGDHAESILNISNPWDVAIKTMNQEMNSAVSNYLTSNPNELIEQITQNLKYSQAGVSTTETSGSLPTMTSVGESRPSSNQTSVVCAASSQVVCTTAEQMATELSRKPVPSPEELDVMASIQKALGVFEDPDMMSNPHPMQENIIIGQQGNEVHFMMNSLPTVTDSSTEHQYRQQQHHHQTQQYSSAPIGTTINPTATPQTFDSSYIHHHQHTQQQEHNQQHNINTANQEQRSHQQQQQDTWQRQHQHLQLSPPVATQAAASVPAALPPQHQPGSTESSLSPQSQHLSPISQTSSQLSPQDSFQTNTSREPEVKEQTRIKKVPLSDIINVKSEILEPTGLKTSHSLEVQQSSLEAFNKYMDLSHKQLADWIEFLQRQRKTANSPNSNTIRAIKKSSNQDFNPEYWQKPALPDENILFTEHHRQVLDQITRAYSAFVEDGHKINQQLTKEFNEWRINAGYLTSDSITDTDFPDFFNKRVVELYTVCSVAYCKKLPGFTQFDPTDQYNIVRLGQSQSRILAAACHWYNREKREFQYFLSWKPKNALREYKFKDSCLKYAEMIVNREWDPIESALTNILVLIATDYPDLRCPAIIEETRMNILRSYRAYTTAKYGTPNRRIEELFSYIPKLRELGLLHYKWTMVTVLEQETLEDRPNSGTQEDLLL